MVAIHNMEKTKIKINLNTGEIEFTGSESFVEKQMDNLDSILSLIKPSPSIANNTESNLSDNDSTPPVTSSNREATDSSNSELSVPASFGEWMHKFKDDISDLDKCLLTAYYVQSASDQNDFKTSEVNNSLKEHGIKLSNPSVSLNRLVEKKSLFQTRKSGKLKYMRVSQDGMQILRSLLR